MKLHSWKFPRSRKDGSREEMSSIIQKTLTLPFSLLYFSSKPCFYKNWGFVLRGPHKLNLCIWPVGASEFDMPGVQSLCIFDCHARNIPCYGGRRYKFSWLIPTCKFQVKDCPDDSQNSIGKGTNRKRLKYLLRTKCDVLLNMPESITNENDFIDSLNYKTQLEEFDDLQGYEDKHCKITILLTEALSSYSIYLGIFHCANCLHFTSFTFSNFPIRHAHVLRPII